MKTSEETDAHSTLVHDLRGPLITMEGFVGEIDQALGELEALIGEGVAPEVIGERLATLLAEDIRPCLAFVETAARSMHGRIDQLRLRDTDTDTDDE